MCLSSGKNVDFKISGATSPEQRSEFMCVYTCECHAQENFAITIEIYGMNIEEEKKSWANLWIKWEIEKSRGI